MIMDTVNEVLEVQQWSFLEQLKILHIFNVDFSDFFLWCTVLVMFCDAFSRSLLGIQEGQNQVLSRYMRKNIAFLVYCTVSYLYNILAFFCFHKALGMQPRVRGFQRNEALIIGYVFLLFGLGIKMYVYSNTPVATIMGGHYFKLDTVPRKVGPVIYTPFYHPLGTTSVICYFGFSVVRASAAGIMLTIALSVGLCSASNLEKYLLNQLQKKQLEQYTFTPIISSDQEDKSGQNFESKLD